MFAPKRMLLDSFELHLFIWKFLNNKPISALQNIIFKRNLSRNRHTQRNFGVICEIRLIVFFWQ